MLVWGERVENTELLTLREAAKAARMSAWRLYRVVHGKAPDVPPLPLVRVGRRAMVRRKHSKTGYGKRKQLSNPIMLFMIIERFKGGDARPIGERFRRFGRMLPEGVVYLSSWIDPQGARCFQVMEAPNPESLTAWVSRWHDLIDFEIVPVLTSGEFWSQVEEQTYRRFNPRPDESDPVVLSGPPSVSRIQFDVSSKS